MPFDGTEYTGDPILAVIDRVDRLICDEKHWFQGSLGRTKPMRGHRPDGIPLYCPVTALGKAAAEYEEAAPAHKYFKQAIPANWQGHPDWSRDCIPAYNNADERTFPEIKALIRKARELRLADIMEAAPA